MPTGKHRQQALLNPERTQLGIRRQAFLSGRPIYLSNKNLRLYLFLPITTAGYCIHIGFWHDRYVLDKFIMLKRSKRPPPGSDIVHHSMLQLIYLCPLFFCLGEIVWPIFIPDQYDRTFILPNMVGIISSLIIFLIPMELIFDLLVRDPYDHLFYDD
jgi:hypothetical protein